MKIQEQAPAKINLTLDILGRRSDGYHELRMVMQSVSLCDTVTVEETGTGFTLLADGFTVPAGKSSLEQQAAEAFFAAVGRPVPPLTVHLEKTTPAYAGLGGGSADVAALLRCLRRQYAPEMPVEQLRGIEDANINYLLASVVDPNFRDPAWYRDHMGKPTPVDAIKDLFRGGEIRALVRRCDLLNGYGPGAVISMDQEDLQDAAIGAAMEELEKN